MSWRPRRETLVLLAGVLSAGALVFAAFGVVRAPEQAGEAELARAAGDVADAVVAEWGRMLRSDEPPFEVAGAVHTWDPERPADPTPGPGPGGAELAPPEPGSATAVLLAESRRLDLAGDAAGALDAALQAASAASSPSALTHARLRALQLAARTGRGDVVREQWELARGALSGAETTDGCPALLLAGLAAAPALEPLDRTSLAAELVERLESGRLALPEAGGRLVLDPAEPRAGTWDSPLARSLAERLGALAGRDDVAARHADQRAASAVRALLESSRAPLPSRDRWSVVPAGDGMLLFARRRDDDTVAAFLARISGVCGAFDAVLTQRELVPEGFSVNLVLGPPDASRQLGELIHPLEATYLDVLHPPAGLIVRDRTPLAGEALGFVVGHRDPTAFVTSERRRARWARSALFAMASFSLIAALSTARAMRRERALAGLRSGFIASVSHELRTPVASILLLVENLESGRAGPGAPQRYHALLRREAHRLRRIVDDVLDISRLERGRPVELRRDVIDLPAFAADLVEEARELAARTGAALEARIGELPATAALDADAMRRAVLNLLDNAAKHAAGGAIELDIAERPGGGGLRIAVADRGPGVPAGQRQRIFEPFARGAADGAGPPGAGLGLSIVRAIVRGHGGEVAVRGREQGPGAVFEIDLPDGGRQEGEA